MIYGKNHAGNKCIIVNKDHSHTVKYQLFSDSNPSILKRNLQDIPCKKSELNFQVDAGMSATKWRGLFYIESIIAEKQENHDGDIKLKFNEVGEHWV